VRSPHDILGSASAERLQAIVEAAPRKVREELFRKAGIKAKSSAFSLKNTGKAARFERLKAKLEAGEVGPTDATEEAIRSFLTQRATLLADALDHFEVKHNHGMTDEDLSFLHDLSPKQVRSLWSHLEARGARVGRHRPLLPVHERPGPDIDRLVSGF
jgi:hypothetical protein